NGELLVGPYQGSLACQKLKKDTGVCWASINQKKTIIVPNVHEFSSHISCDSRTNSEIVVPVYLKNGNIAGVLDIDSRNLNQFDETDKKYLEAIINFIDFS
ncbi:MAG: GAF domain-containing protein, partial [Ferruginibacter sp.]